MLKIEINWTFTSPVLQVAVGTLKILEVDMKNGYEITPLITCKVKKEQGTIGFKYIDGEYYHIFEELKPRIDAMIQSYYYGMVLENYDFSWIDDSADLPLDKWLEKRGLTKKEKEKVCKRDLKRV